MALHRDPTVWGPNPDAFDPENFSQEAEAKRPINAWKPFGNGQRACIGRGFAMHEAALAIGMILQRFKLVDHPALPDAAQGDADDQARRLQDQGAPARRQGSRRVRRPCRRRQRPPRTRRAPRAADPAGPQHAAVGALRLQSRHRRGTRDARRRSRRGQRLCHQARAARRLRRQAAGAGRRADLLRVLQWRGAGQRHAVRQMAGRRSAEGCVRESALRRVRLRQQRLGRDLSVDPAHDRRAAGGARRAQRLCARRGRCAQRSRRPVRELVCRAGPPAVKEFGLDRASPAAPTTSRCTRSSRWRRAPSTPWSRSAASRR